MRIFTALLLPEDFSKKLYLEREALRNTQPRIRWIPPENYHITLQFLGEITAKEAEEAAYLLEEVAENHSPFPISTHGPGQFPGSGQPRVIFEAIQQGKKECMAISRDYVHSLKLQDYQLENRKYHPHITLARVPRNKEWHSDLDKGILLNSLKSEIQSLGIFKSTLSSQGAHYRLLASFPLTKVAQKVLQL